jgi:hypothetical protein
MLSIAAALISTTIVVLVAVANETGATALRAIDSRFLGELRVRGAFELAHEVADTDLRLDVDRHVNVRRHSADAMQEYSSNFSTAIVEQLIDFGFESSRNQGLAVFGVPIQVQKNLMEDVAGHGAIARGKPR